MYTYDGIGSHERVGYSCQVSVLLTAIVVRLKRFEQSAVPFIKGGNGEALMGQLPCILQGSGSNLIQPVLDNQLAAASKLVRLLPAFSQLD